MISLFRLLGLITDQQVGEPPVSNVTTPSTRRISSFFTGSRRITL